MANDPRRPTEAEIDEAEVASFPASDPHALHVERQAEGREPAADARSSGGDIALGRIKNAVIGQFEAALSMHDECLRRCPAEHWDASIAKYPFWMVAYHTLCFVDCYLAPNDDAFQVRPEYHPRGRAELDEEYPSRRFTQQELLAYAAICRQRLRRVIEAETRETLEGHSGFSHLPFSRLELHLYNIRHVQHHTGQLTAFLRRVGIDTPWVRTGWRAAGGGGRGESGESPGSL
ncbi:MAG: DinB family protein [Phycisphaerales bacterium]